MQVAREVPGGEVHEGCARPELLRADHGDPVGVDEDRELQLRGGRGRGRQELLGIHGRAARGVDEKPGHPRIREWLQVAGEEVGQPATSAHGKYEGNPDAPQVLGGEVEHEGEPNARVRCPDSADSLSSVSTPPNLRLRGLVAAAFTPMDLSLIHI